MSNSIAVYNSDGTLKAVVNEPNFILPGRITPSRIDYGLTLAADNSEAHLSKAARPLVEISPYKDKFVYENGKALFKEGHGAENKAKKPSNKKEPKIIREQPTLALGHVLALIANNALLITIIVILFSWSGAKQQVAPSMTFEQELSALYSQGWSNKGNVRLNKGKTFTYAIDHECLIRVVADKDFKLQDANNLVATPVKTGENVMFIEREAVRKITIIAIKDNTRFTILEKTGGSGDLLKSLTSWIKPVKDYLFQIFGTISLAGLIVIVIASIAVDLYLIRRLIPKVKSEKSKVDVL